SSSGIRTVVVVINFALPISLTNIISQTNTNVFYFRLFFSIFFKSHFHYVTIRVELGGVSMNKKKIMTYILWLYGLSFGAAALFFATGLGNHILLLSIFMMGYMLMPLMAVLIVQKLVYKEKLVRPLLMAGRPNWWWLFAM